VATVCNQNVLRLQVPVIDPNGMTLLNGIQNLQGVLGKCVVSNNMASFGDIGEQVALRKEHNFNKRKIGPVQAR